MRSRFLALLVYAAAIPLAAQPAPEPVPTPSLIDSLGALVKDGHLSVQADLHAGSVPAIPKYALEVQGSPKSTIEADASNGSV
ncbi:MAG: hypothetical protein ABI968_07970, partial [Acidobacteriota bacterium]